MKKKVIIILLSFVFLFGFFTYQLFVFADDKLHVVFCDVGQGDAILIKTPSHKIILYDSGPGTKVLDCLTNHLPFWTRTIDLAILSHPHNDHYEGYNTLLSRYTIKSFALEHLNNSAESYQDLISSLKNKKIPTTYIYAGDVFKISDGVSFHILAPTHEYLQVTSPKNFVGETREFANSVVLVTYGKFRLLLTGDSQSAGLIKAIGDRGVIDVLQIPHHGSKTGLSQEILDILQPQLAVISVGAKNKYGHPAPSTLTLLQKNNVRFLMTKDRGDIEIVSEGKGFRGQGERLKM